MTYALLIVLALFCAVVGSGLASNHLTWWAVVLFAVLAIVALEAGYVFTSILVEH